MPHKIKKGLFREYTEAIVVAVLIALVLRSFVIEAFKIPSGSMIPTLKIGDHIFVNKFIYGLRIPYTKIRFFQFRTPKQGEIIVFIYPVDNSKDYIKRVVGLPGDTLEMKQGTVYINGQAVGKTLQTARNILKDIDGNDSMDLYKETTGTNTHYTLYYNSKFKEPDDFASITIPQNKLFVMGDNRDNSSDSRAWRFVPMENIKGRAMFVWLSLDSEHRLSLLKFPMVRLNPSPHIEWEGLPSIRWERFGKLIR
ncbi:MAG: signal peptidase I [Deltaproteobacteria bacterium]|nr:signal peptidase I [Deltaproteobacteria bacterium]